MHATQYGLHRFTVDIESTPQEFRDRYELAVPALPMGQVNDLVRRQAPWQEMINLLETAKPSGIFIYFKLEFDRELHATIWVRLAGPRTLLLTNRAINSAVLGTPR